jgi:hypothetical protein
MQRPVVGGRGVAVEGEAASRVDVDEIVDDRPALRVDPKMALQIDAAENDQKAERQRQSDQSDRPLWRELRRGARRDALVSRRATGVRRV